jgi:SpoVK/Ycf46/Vps4 family AAA+-type ATPase
MDKATSNNWYETNQRYLSAALATMRSVLEQHAKSVGTQPIAPELVDNSPATNDPTASPVLDADIMSNPSALDMICAAFNLSPFERDILLLCAGIELDATFPTLCAAAQGDPLRTYPTFSLALAALPEAHWSALTPNAPLRRWRLIEVHNNSGLTSSPLRIDERILHYLAGIQHLDDRLVGMLEPVRAGSSLVSSHQMLAERLVKLWTQAAEGSMLPVAQLCGNEIASKRAIAAAACHALELNLYALSAYALPSSPAEFEALIRLWEREAILSGSALLLDCDDSDTSDAARERAIAHLSETVSGVLIVSSCERRQLLQRPVVSLDVRKPTASEQRGAWKNALGTAAQSLNGKVETLVSQFSLSVAAISSASAEVLGHLPQTGITASDDLQMRLWDTCRTQARPRLDDLAQHIEPAATWNELVLPELQCQVLRDIAIHVKQRATVYETWGFASRGARGLGISALFAGASGTGKTMAAEVLAHELRLDLYRIDLSQVVSKYIGETEKNLRRVFDAAEEGGAILLFDEADALFGKRSEVKDSHDRYANIEVSYLLQRMEAYRGLAILTTNMKNALDAAFLRRIRFIVQFPFPDAVQRAEIWRHIFPPNTPTEGLDMTRLARLNVTGGNIRNIALNAAFLAADAQEPVRMTHLLRAARSEYTKLEKAPTEAEIGGWA